MGGLVDPALDDLVSVDECSDEWRLYVRWWRANDGIRNSFCTRELKFVERDVDVSNAEKDGISMRDRHSMDPQLREQFLRRFGSCTLAVHTRTRIQPTALWRGPNRANLLRSKRTIF